MKKKRIISIYNQVPALKISEEQIEAVMSTLDGLTQCSIPDGELSIAFLDDEAIIQLHADFLDDSTATDVITFPGDPEDDFAGEICMSVEQAQRVCAEYNNPFNRELALYLVHGWLHLAGYKDKSSEEQQEMRRMEAELMDVLQNARVLPDFIISDKS